MLTYSLLLGLAAWALGAAAVAVKGRGRGALVWGSFLCAAASALWQFVEIEKRACAGDWAGVEDTIRAVMLGVAVMFAVTLALDLWATLRRN